MTLAKNTYKYLFTPSGCITAGALEKFNLSELSPGETALIRDHIENCMLCSEALEGLTLLESQNKLTAIAEELNEDLNKKILSGKYDQAHSSIFLSKKLLTVAAAASVVIFIGLYSYLQLYEPNGKIEISELTKQHEQKTVENYNYVAEPEQSETNELKIEQEEPADINLEENKPAPMAMKVESSDMGLSEDDPIVQYPEEKITEEITGLDYEPEESNPIHDRPVDLASVNQPIAYFIDGITVGIVPDRSEKYENNPIIAEYSEPNSMDLNKNESGNDQFIEDGSFGEGESGQIEKIITEIEQLPAYPGGDKALYKYLYTHLIYPEEAREKGLQGTVLISFVVEKSGAITNITTNSNVGGGCESSAIQVIEKMPDWNPGMNHGKPVRVQYTMPIKFSLDK